MNGNTPPDHGKPPAGAANRESARNAATGVPPRRIVLRGALAAGCSLLMPAALLGCNSGKEDGTAGKDGAAPMADPASSGLPGPTPETESAAPAAPAKVSQASVQYQTQPKGEQQCANCRHFIAESNTCQLVEGNINPAGWCVLWAKEDLSRGDRNDRNPVPRLA